VKAGRITAQLFLACSFVFVIAQASAAQERFEKVFFSRTTWEKADWTRIDTSAIWSMDGWAKDAEVLAEIPEGPYLIGAFRAERIIGLPMIALQLTAKQPQQYVNQVGIEANGESPLCSDLIKRLLVAFGSAVVDADASRGSRVFRAAEWVLGPTRIQLKCAPDEAQKATHLTLIAAHRDALRPLKSLLVIHCALTKIDEPSKQMEKVITIDENLDVAFEENSVLAAGDDVTVTATAISLTQRIGFLYSYEISRTTGNATVSASIGTTNAGTLFAGNCAKASERRPEF
jgi:hypothetical protein